MSNQYPLFTLRTQEIAGRRDLLARLEQARRKITTADAGTHLFYLIGKGGMGKTRILEELRDAQPPLDNQCVTTIIDFYEIANHSSINLQESIVNKLPEGETTQQVFAEYKAQLQSFRNIAASGMGDERQRKRLGEAFLAAWRTYTEQCSVVILLDTAELLQFQDDEVRAKLNLPLPEANSKSWLFTAIAENKLPRTLFVIAGRPRPALDEELHALAVTHQNIVIYPLERLDHEECKEYFDHLAKTLAEVHPEQAEEITQLPYSLRHSLIHLTDGRPIALALALQLYLSNIGGKFRDLVEQADAQASENQEALRKALMQGIMYEAFGDIGLLLRIMPITRRGLTPQLLGVLLKDYRSEEQWAQMIKDLKAQIFVKTRPDGSIVLHDEIADWAEHELYVDDQVTARRLYQKVADYYHDLFRKVRTEIRNKAVETNQFLEDMTEESDTVETATGVQSVDVYGPLLDAVEERRRIAINRLFYALRADAFVGFQYYYELAEEAFNVNLVDYDAQIHSEFLQWWDAKAAIDNKSFSQRAAAATVGITSDVVNADLALRWVQRQYNKAGADAKQETVMLIQRIRESLPQLDAIARLRLTTYELTARSQQIDLTDEDVAEIEQAFVANLQDLQALAQADDEEGIAAFLAKDARAFVEYEAGYFQRSVLGHYGLAVQHFNRSARLYKELRFEINQARSLNDRAYALARAADIESALLSIGDALKLRIELGVARAVALSLNTKGLIYVYAFKPSTAVALCQRALSIFLRLEDEWGEMLAYLALSEANRRKSEGDGITLDDKANALVAAADYSDRCLKLAEKLQAPPTLLAEILDEYACALRDRAIYLQDVRRDKELLATINELWQQASEKLKAALSHVSSRQYLRYLAMDFKTDQAYLAYYNPDNPDDFGSTISLLNEALELAPRRVRESERQRSDSEPAGFHDYRMQLAKIHALKSQLVGEEIDKLADQDASARIPQDLINQFVEDASWTLYYTADLPHFRQTRKAKQYIYDRLCPLSVKLLQQISSAANGVEDRLGLRKDIVDAHGLRAFIKKHFDVD